MTNKLEKKFVLGGSVESALSGNYELKGGAVLQEAWRLTIKNFLTFSPAIVALLILQVFIFYMALKLQLGDPIVIFQMFQDPELLSSGIIDAIYIANFSYEVVSAPIYAGVSLMAMSHAAGLPTKPMDVMKGLSFTIPVILATLVSLIFQGVGGLLFPLLSMYFSIAFSHAILLVCEKRMQPLQSLLLSFRAINKKLLPLLGIFILMGILMFLSALFYGFLLIFTLPFFFHVKGILYRNMFGISLKVVSLKSDNDENSDGNGNSSDTSDTVDTPKSNHNSKDSDIFNA